MAQIHYLWSGGAGDGELLGELLVGGFRRAISASLAAVRVRTWVVVNLCSGAMVEIGLVSSSGGVVVVRYTVLRFAILVI